MSTAGRLARFANLPTFTTDLGPLPSVQRALWLRLGDVPEPFVLYGGTALALRLGHRESADFDFFTDAPFRGGELLDALRWLGRLEIGRQADNNLSVVEPGGVQLSFFGNLELQAVAEPSIAPDNGVVVASVYDLAATNAKAICDRSEWKDYVDIAELLRAGHRLADIIGYATTVFDRRFAFPTPEFLRSLVWYEDGTAGDVPAGVRGELEAAVRGLDLADIPRVDPFRTTITP
ncbi:MAG: nucleotidyl transferase AbiEii/AbiGii toxin family protein [Candidatus Limnocylindrales bacterium]